VKYITMTVITGFAIDNLRTVTGLREER